MWKENPAQDRTRAAAIAKPINEEEFRSILDRLESVHETLHENGELRDLLSYREAEVKDLRARNAEMEETLRKFGPILIEAGTAMELVVKNEKPPTKIFT